MASSGQNLQNKFIEVLGKETFEYDPGWAHLLKLDPELFAAGLEILSVPKRKNHLSPKIQSLIALSVCASCTHLYAPGVRIHTAAALKAGATLDEIKEILELTSVLGIHAVSCGVPTLVDLLNEEGIYDKMVPGAQNPLSNEQESLQAAFTKARGYWHPRWGYLLRLSPELFKAYLGLSGLPWTKDVKHDNPPKGALEPKIKELVYCAIDAAATHMYVQGLKLHYKNALGYGATIAELMEVLEIATGIGLHTGTLASGIVLEEYAKFQQGK